MYRIIFLFLALATVSQLKAQSSHGNYNFLGFEQKPYYFGITLAYNTSDYRPFRSKNFLESDSIVGIESVSGPGFNLGIVTNLKVGDYFDLRLLPTLSFGERNLVYNRESRLRPVDTRKVSSVFVEMPFHVRYKSEPFNDMRLFVVAGMKYSFDVASDSKTRQASEFVKISPTDFAVEAGFGAQFFFPYFIFSPEFKTSFGMNNILLYDGQLEDSTVLEKILSRTFTISFHFEG
ncbi:MAG: outer membrane beta-barrel protein [Bacteroidota bacterium]